MSSKLDKVKEFRNVTGESAKVATAVLAANNNDLDRALDDYYNNTKKYASLTSTTSSSSTKGDEGKISKIFEKYSGASGDELADEALAQFFTDIGVDPIKQAATTLAIAWFLQCKDFGAISKEEFIKGFSNAGADTLDKMKREAKRLEQLLSDKKSFKEFYRWMFSFIKDEESRKTVDPDAAYEMWAILLPLHFPLHAEWLDFCKNHAQLKAIHKDLWDQLFEFIRDVNPQLTNYDEDGAWPLTIDEFVAFQRKKNGIVKK